MGAGKVVDDKGRRDSRGVERGLKEAQRAADRGADTPAMAETHARRLGSLGGRWAGLGGVRSWRGVAVLCGTRTNGARRVGTARRATSPGPDAFCIRAHVDPGGEGVKDSHGLPTRVPMATLIAAYSRVNAFAPVPDRALLHVAGKDAVKFLQGLITNHMPKIERGGDGFLAAFLTAQGRVLFDSFIFPENIDTLTPSPHNKPLAPSFLLDHDARLTDDLLAHLQRYKMRNAVTLANVSEAWTQYQVWGPQSALLWGNYVGGSSAACRAPAEGPGAHPPSSPGAAFTAPSVPGNTGSPSSVPVGTLVPRDGFVSIGCRDTRGSGMGLRVVVPKSTKLPLPSSFCPFTPNDYTLKRMLTGVAEGSGSIIKGAALPLESNFDYMSGIDFRKGCYLGQELTIRTFHRGVTRKRIMPVLIRPHSHSSDVPIVDFQFAQATPAGVDVFALGSSPEGAGATGKQRPVGKFCESILNVGLSLVKLDALSPAVPQPPLPSMAPSASPAPVATPSSGSWQLNEQVFEAANEGAKPIHFQAAVPDWWNQGVPL